ncbi:MAG: NAD(+)/NADH kinase [Dehalococcoidales bacterium]|nr:NAD(+)/NADH kinase [Dehalococcoidales bacterium]
MEKVGILYHPMNRVAYPLAEELQGLLSSQGLSVWLCSAWEEDKARGQLDGTELIFSIGGDGTVLRAAQVVVSRSIPITGINLGRLGFMTELSVDELKVELPVLLRGEGWLDERAMLEVELSASDKKVSAKFFALNDVVMARGEVARMVCIEASIDGEPMTTYWADGVIMATATGSTGYSLSAGGPILHPQAKEFLLLPILPHLSSAYPLVLPPAAVVKLAISAARQATLSIDGHINLPLASGDTLTIKRSRNTTRFLRIHRGDSFYGSLERRLKGKHQVEDRKG